MERIKTIETFLGGCKIVAMIASDHSGICGTITYRGATFRVSELGAQQIEPLYRRGYSGRSHGKRARGIVESAWRRFVAIEGLGAEVQACRAFYAAAEAAEAAGAAQ